MLVEEHCDDYSEESRNLRHLLCFPSIPFRVERLRMSHAPVTFEWRAGSMNGICASKMSMVD